MDIDIRVEPVSVKKFVEEHGDFFGSYHINNPIVLGFGPQGLRTPKHKWKTPPSTIGQFAAHCMLHPAMPEKDTCPAFTQGPMRHGRRMSAQMKWMDVMALDVDTGEPPEIIIRRIRDLGLMAVLFTTFSHSKQVEEKSRASLVKLYGEGAGHAEYVDWLLTAKRTYPPILEGVEFLGENAKGELIIRHKPMPRYRIVLFLLERFDCGEDGARQNEWRELYMGVAALLNANVDRSCHDLARLQYFPAHKIGAKDWHVDLIAGRLLDLSTITPVPLPRGAVGKARRPVAPRVPRDRTQGEPDGWAEQALASETQEFATFGMRRFLARHGKTFRVVDFIKDAKPLWIRGRASEGMTIQCPGEDEHSESGGSGCYAVNGTGKKGFIINCRHDSCQGRDRADFLDLLCDEVNITNVNQLKGYV